MKESAEPAFPMKGDRSLLTEMSFLAPLLPLALPRLLRNPFQEPHPGTSSMRLRRALAARRLFFYVHTARVMSSVHARRQDGSDTFCPAGNPLSKPSLLADLLPYSYADGRSGE